MQRLTLLGLAGALSILASADSPRAQGATPRALVLDQDARSLTIVDVATGEALQTATLPGSPAMLRRTGDGKTLLVLDRGAGSDAGDAGLAVRSRVER